MATLLIQHRVKDFSTWKKIFDSKSDLRSASGELSAQVFRDANDPNRVTVINKWKSLESAQKFTQSPELREAMEKSGVEGQPAVFFLNEV